MRIPSRESRPIRELRLYCPWRVLSTRQTAMLRTILLAQFRSPQQAVRLRLWMLAGLAAMGAGAAALRPTTPPEAVEALAWTLFVVAIVAGGVLTGWRAAQFPKSRAAEFQFVLPVSDAAVLAGEMLPGMLRTAL